MEDTVSKQKYILITNGQSYVGSTAALYIADQLDKHKDMIGKSNWKVRVLCEDKPKLSYLKKRGIDVQEVDYGNQHMISEKMKVKIKAMIFNPSTKHNCLLEEGRNIIQSAIRQKVKRIVMISVHGCEHFMDKSKPLYQYYKLEEYLRCNYKFDYWMIFRVPFIQQYLYFWANMIEDGVLGLPLKITDVLENVNIQDVCECLAQMVLSKKKSVWVISEDTSVENLKRIYKLKSSSCLTSSMIATELSNALREADKDRKIEAEELSDDQFKKYLKHISDSGKNNDSQVTPNLFNNHLVDSTTDLKVPSEGSSDLYQQLLRIPKDRQRFVPCPSEVLTSFRIEMLLDYMIVTRSNQPIIPYPNNDISDLTGYEPIHISSFFKSNLDRFKSE